MADIKHSQIEIQVNLELVAQIKWLMKYKAAADEALSYLITNEKDAHAAQLMLTALNIGAHEQPLHHSVQSDLGSKSHIGDPCIFCNVAHDDVSVGDCSSRPTSRATDLPIVCDNCLTSRETGDFCENCGSANRQTANANR